MTRAERRAIGSVYHSEEQRKDARKHGARYVARVLKLQKQFALPIVGTFCTVQPCDYAERCLQ